MPIHVMLNDDAFVSHRHDVMTIADHKRAMLRDCQRRLQLRLDQIEAVVDQEREVQTVRGQ